MKAPTAVSADWLGSGPGGRSLSVVAEPPYSRSWISLHPIGVMAIAPGTPEFVLSSGAVAKRESRAHVHFTAGLALNLNLLSFGPQERIGMGIGLAGGTNGGQHDLMLGPVFSWEDRVRLGFGFGASRFKWQRFSC